MESIIRGNHQKNTDKTRCGTFDCGYTTGSGMGQKRFKDIYQNTKRQNRLEWRC
tara:strand:- start:375 stop:536 length:162 start_codon:yes stop_codon:yes gene_type:complete